MPNPEFFRKVGCYVAPDFLDGTSCARLSAEMSAATVRKGLVARAGETEILDETVRKVWSAKVEKGTSRFVKERLLERKPLIEAHFGIELAKCESPDFLVYSAGSFFEPHHDAIPASAPEIRSRVVSAVIFLNPRTEIPAPQAYGGGALTFYGLLDGPNWEDCAFSLNPEPGLLIAFRSNILHEVKPVTFGQRYTIATWFHSERE